MKNFTGLIFVILGVLFFASCFLTPASEEDFDIRGTWNVTAVDNTNNENSTGSLVFSGTKESGIVYGAMWGQFDSPSNYTVKEKKVTLVRANHPPDNDGMNADGEFAEADIVSGTWWDFRNHVGTWNMTRAD